MTLQKYIRVASAITMKNNIISMTITKFIFYLPQLASVKYAIQKLYEIMEKPANFRIPVYTERD